MDKTRLLPHHQEMLLASGITTEVIEQRGYRSVTKQAELRRLGFGENQCSVPSLLLPICTVTSQSGGYQSRPDQPRFVNGKVVKYETPKGMKMALDIHPSVRHLLSNPAIPLFITEGIKKGDALATQGCCAVALLGVWNWRGTNDEGGKVALPEWELVPLNGRQVCIVFDSDVVLKPQVHQAMVRLKSFLESRGASVAIIYLPGGQSGEKVGVDDYLAAGHSIDDLLALASPQLRQFQSNEQTLDEDGSQADLLVAIGRQAKLFHDPTGNAFAAINFDGHMEVWPLRAKRYDHWLRLSFFRLYHKAPGGDAVRTALGVLEGMAVFDGREIPLANRVALHEGAIYYDLTDAKWRAVRIDSHGWEVVEHPPVLFRRYAHQRPQVVPVDGGDASDIFRFLNVRLQDRLLLLVWLIAAFIPNIPHPISEFHGGKGSGKSMGQKLIRRLIDPSELELLSFPNEVRELVQQLSHHYSPCYDNIDGLHPWLSDLLCRAVTGDGFSKRELFSDDDDIIYKYIRVILLNGINIVAQRPDLLDRTIPMQLERLTTEQRREESDLWKIFESVRPGLMGAIFTAVSEAMRIYPTLRLKHLERMADFTRWGAAIAEALGYGAESFLSAYTMNISAQTREAAEGHVVGAAVLALMHDRKEWSGTPTELLSALEQAGEDARLFKRSASGKVDAKSWPGAPHILTRRLNEVRSNLADLGILIKESPGDQRKVFIEWSTQEPTNDSESLETSEDDGTDATDATFGILESGVWERIIP